MSDTLPCLRTTMAVGSNTRSYKGLGAAPDFEPLIPHCSHEKVLEKRTGAASQLVDQAKEVFLNMIMRRYNKLISQSLAVFSLGMEVRKKEGLDPPGMGSMWDGGGGVQCLCLAGCSVEQKSREGILAEVCAMAQGYDDISGLLNKLRGEATREDYIQQLIPCAASIPRVKVKCLGHSGTGKSTLIETLKTGYFSSFFKRTKSNASATSIGSLGKTLSQAALKGHYEMESPLSSRQNSLTFEPCDNYTKGIEVQQVNISGVGELSMWEFSGHEAYFSTYDHFIGNTACAHLVVFPLNQPFDIQLQQCSFWLSFLQARIPPMEPLNVRGRPSKAAKVALVGTHADIAQCHRNAQGEFLSPQVHLLQEKLVDLFGDQFEIHDCVFVMDAAAPGSPAIRALKQYLTDTKAKVTQVPLKGFLGGIIDYIFCAWRSFLGGVQFPIVS
ncbi:unnamed protein product, partial [Meganyctiphanes norvegica]